MPYRRTYADDDVVAGDAVDAEVVDERATSGPALAWSPAQIIGLIAGIGFTVLGIVAVARTGFDTGDIYQPHMSVWGLQHSPLLGVCEIAWGVLMIIASVIPGGARAFMAVLGAIALVFGIVILVNAGQSDLQRWLAVTHRNGWLYTITGAVVLLAAMLSPVFYSGGYRRQRVHRSNRTYA